MNDTQTAASAFFFEMSPMQPGDRVFTQLPAL
jgi:hypothetical protein